MVLIKATDLMTLNLCGQPRSMCGAEYSGGMALCQSSRKRERKSFQIWTVHRLVLAAPFHEPTLYHKKESKLFFGGCRKLAGVNGFFGPCGTPSRLLQCIYTVKAQCACGENIGLFRHGFSIFCGLGALDKICCNPEEAKGFENDFNSWQRRCRATY